MPLYDAAIDTTRKVIRHRDFTIANAFDGGWDWACEDRTNSNPTAYGVWGTAPTLFRAIEDIELWYAATERAP